MKKPRKLVLKKERIRVLGTHSLRAAVGGDTYDSNVCGYNDGATNLPDGDFTPFMWNLYVDTNWYDGEIGGDSGWEI